MKSFKNTWKKYTARQQPHYKDKKLLNSTLKQIRNLPPLVFAEEIRELRICLNDVFNKKAFILQGGDCAESFANFNAINIRDTFKILLQMAIVLTFSNSHPIVKIGRIAGQFAKPRSEDFEIINGKKLPIYRGDIINDINFDEKSRQADPKRMLKAYYQSAATLNLLRAFANGGLADLNNIHRLNLNFIKKNSFYKKYEQLIEQISKSLAFMKACGINSNNTQSLKTTNIYTSHEALLLDYEQALTRVDSLSGEIYDCSAHMLWIGDRTKGLNEAHVHFLSNVKNPIGVKISSNDNFETIYSLNKILNPKNENNRLNMIIRMGTDKIKKNLPDILKNSKKEGLNIIYTIDPMHANTIKIDGYKTRNIEKIKKELKLFFEICKAEDIYPAGVHLEMSGQNVSECIGCGVSQNDLYKRYETRCDPRLNADQALELAFFISDLFKKVQI